MYEFSNCFNFGWLFEDLFFSSDVQFSINKLMFSLFFCLLFNVYEAILIGREEC